MSEHRETTNAAMDQAIPHLAADIASGRAEPDILFFQKERKLPYHAVAGGRFHSFSQKIHFVNFL